MNDSLRTNVFVRFTPETIACACIFLSARQLRVRRSPMREVASKVPSTLFLPLQIGLPQKPPWWNVFEVTFEDIEVCLQLQFNFPVYLSLMF